MRRGAVARRWGPSAWLAVAGLAAWALLPLVLAGRLSLSIFVFASLYATIVIGLSLLAGYAGQVSLGQAAFYGLGAYITGILTARYGLSPWLGVPAAVAGTAAIAYVVGAPILMLRGHYLVVGTLGFNIIVEVLMRQLYGLTGGPSGLTGIPALAAGGVRLQGNTFYYYAAGLLALAAAWLSTNLVRSRFGRALQAIQASETAAESLAVDPARYKAYVFAWSAALAGAAGALYAHYLTFVSPSPFSFTFSVELLMMAVLGGIASVPGAVLGAAVAVLLRETLRSVVPRFMGHASAEYEIVVFGILLAVVVIAAPEGIWPRLAAWVAGRRGSAGLPTDAVRPEAPRLGGRPGGDAPAPPLLRVEGVSRRFGGLVAVRDLSFEVRPGEVFAIIGPNGAGKTTLFNLISGVLRPSGGRIELDGRRIDGLPAHRIAALGVARTFQTPRLFPLLSAVENVMVGLHRHLRAGFIACALRRTRAEERAALARSLGALELVGASELAAEPIDTLPFGAHRMIELARALASEPRLLLLDEPASGLSAPERAELGDLIRRIRAAGVAVILVEHDVGFVMGVADRVLVMHHGERITEGLPAEVRRHPEVIAAYLGDAAEAGGEAPATGGEAPATGGEAPATGGEAPKAGAAAPAAGSEAPRARGAAPGGPARGAAPGGPARGPAPGGPALGDGAVRRPLLEVADLTAGYGPIRILQAVNFTAGAGEIVAVLGPNGAGKTTLMRAVSGLIPARGRVCLEGRDLLGLPAERVAAAGVVLVPERRQLLETMSVADHLILGAYTRLRRSSRSEIEADIQQMYRLFPILYEKRHQPARSLSGGQQQMLAIARALMARPRVLCLDEPLLGLAPLVVQDILRAIGQMRDEGLAVVLVEQNAAAVLPMADRAYVLEGGRVVLAGPASELRRTPELQAVFLGGSIAGETRA